MPVDKKILDALSKAVDLVDTNGILAPYKTIMLEVYEAIISMNQKKSSEEGYFAVTRTGYTHDDDGPDPVRAESVAILRSRTVALDLARDYNRAMVAKEYPRLPTHVYDVHRIEDDEDESIEADDVEPETLGGALKYASAALLDAYSMLSDAPQEEGLIPHLEIAMDQVEQAIAKTQPNREKAN